MKDARLGVIAGAGRFPEMVVRGARRAGLHVTVIGLKALADPGLVRVADAFYWSGVARLGGWIRRLRRARIHRVILAGSVRKTEMYGRFRLLKHIPDWTALRLWFFSGLKDRRNDTILCAVADEFARHDIVMEPCVQYTPEHMAAEGVLTRRQPTQAQWDDARFGWPLAKALGRLDIGQAIAVHETEVIAVEAIEGTARMIERAGELCPRGGWTLIKTAKPDQDMRFDVPAVGPDTIAQLAQARAGMLVIEAGKTLVIDREAMLEQADRHHIVVLGLADRGP